MSERSRDEILARLRGLDGEGFERAREAAERFMREGRDTDAGLRARYEEPAHVFELVRASGPRTPSAPRTGGELPPPTRGPAGRPEAVPGGLHFESWLELARRYRQGELTPLEHVEALLARIGALDGALHAFLHVDEEGAREAARAAGERIARGRPLGLLDGIPFGLKDIIDAAGLPTTCHSAILRGNVAREDATVTRRLRSAGGVLLGKLATHEFALGGPSFDLPWPPARNPWDPDRFPGGSSSGSGVAVAAGMLPLALGTDTGGSVRNPASQCGLVGMKPTYGRVSRKGVFPLAFSLDHVGPLTRTVAENAAALELLAGFDPADPGSAACADGGFAGSLGQGVEGLRIGVLRHFHERDLVADPEVGGAIDRALERLAELGARVEDVEAEPLEVYARCNRTLLLAEAWAVHEPWLASRPGDYGRLTRERLLPGAFLGAGDYVQATRERRRLTHGMSALLERVDVLVAASSLDPPGPIEDEEIMRRTYPRQARAPFNLTGHPALAVPAGFTAGGLPLSFQLVGPHFGERLLYRVAAAWEEAAGLADRHPAP